MARFVHKLKTAAVFYQPLQDGAKTFEIRFDDRAYRVGDYLHLCEWLGDEFTGRNVWRRVGYILTAAEFPGLAAGYVCMGFGDVVTYDERLKLGASLETAVSQFPHRLDRLGDCKDCTYPSSKDIDPLLCPAANICDCPEVCKHCGGRAAACAQLGCRSDRSIGWHECPTANRGVKP